MGVSCVLTAWWVCVNGVVVCPQQTLLLQTSEMRVSPVLTAWWCVLCVNGVVVCPVC